MPVSALRSALASITLALAVLAGCDDGASTPDVPVNAEPDGAAVQDADAPEDLGPDATPPDAAVDAGPADPAVAQVGAGRVLGEHADGVVAFRGIPYAAAPVGGARFAPPGPVPPWDGERPALDWPPPCPQRSSATGEILGSEDCLAVNVWRPEAAEAAPVLVFIHGGGNMFGSTSELNSGVHIYSGARLARRFGVVVVTLQYRLNILGYLADPALGELDGGAPANWGMRDQIAALGWVQRNIAAFGGDPDRVLLFGESGGAASVCGLVASPAAAGLFSAAIMQSGGCGGRPLAEVRAWGDEVAAAVGCADAADRVACLRGADLDELVRAASQGQMPLEGVAQNPAGPTVDGVLLPEGPLAMMQAGAHNQVPLVFGANAMETAWPFFGIVGSGQVWDAARYEARVRAMFGPRADAVLAQYAVGPDGYPNHAAALIALTTDVQFVCPTRTYARAAAANQAAPVYRYLYDHAMEGGAAGLRLLGAFHGAELLYQFQHIEHIEPYDPSPGDLAVQAALGQIWVDFARTGAPDPSLGWSAWDAEDRYLRISDPPSAEAGLRSAACDFWESLF